MPLLTRYSWNVFDKNCYSYRFIIATENASKFDETNSNTGDSVKEDDSNMQQNKVLRLHDQPSNTSNRDYDPNR